MSVPSGWDTNLSPETMLAAPAEGDAMLMFSPDTSVSVDSAVAAFARAVPLEDVKSEATSFNGLLGHRIGGILRNPQNPEEVFFISTYFLEHRARVYRVLGISYAQGSAKYSPLFTASMKSVAGLTDPDKLHRLPERIRIFSAGPDKSLRQHLTERGMPESRMEELAMLNGMKPDKIVESGVLVKYIGK